MKLHSQTLPEDICKQIAQPLQETVVDYISLASVARQAHWAVVGREFRSFHAYMDELRKQGQPPIIAHTSAAHLHPHPTRAGSQSRSCSSKTAASWGGGSYSAVGSPWMASIAGERSVLRNGVARYSAA